MLQLRPKEGGTVNVSYAPARDICYLYPNVIEAVEQMLYQMRFPALKKWLKAEGITEEQLANTVEAYCKFMNAAHQNPEESPEDVMDRVGFTKCPGPAQVALMFYIGSTMTGTFFKGIRDITPLGEDSTHEVKRLMGMATRIADYGTRGPIGRWWIRMKKRLWPLKKRYTINGRES